MPLSPSEERELVHTRRLECQGYRRHDGLWDIEGSLVDTRTETMETFGRGVIPPGEHLHEMWLRMTVDSDLTVQAIEAKTVHAPYPNCPNFPDRFPSRRPSNSRLRGVRNWRPLPGKCVGPKHSPVRHGPGRTRNWNLKSRISAEMAPLKARRRPNRP